MREVVSAVLLAYGCRVTHIQKTAAHEPRRRLPAVITTLPRITQHARWLALRLKQRIGWLDRVKIHPFRGHGTPWALYVRGRVVEKKAIMPAAARDSLGRNLLNMYRRFTSSAVADARVRARFRGIEEDAITDIGGYFDFHIAPEAPLDSTQVWHEVALELLEPDAVEEGAVRATACALVPTTDAEFGIISDIDDTVIESSAARLLTMLRIVLLNNAYTRLPFKGVTAFYQALQHGEDGDRTNPIFYVSSSPWNIYDLLVDFLDIHGLPAGPLFLRDWSSEQWWVDAMRHMDHKRQLIVSLLDTYPHLPFLLIGDSGQEDPEIYRQIVRDYPGRIAAVYIRNVTQGERARAVGALAEEVCALGVDMLLVEDTIAAAEHAAANGYISATSLPRIRVDKRRDEDKPGMLEHIIHSNGVIV